MHSAERCAECHGEIAASWATSTHARANTTPLFLALGGADPSCSRCHGPTAAFFEAGAPAAREGVNCDACHIAVGVTRSRFGGALELRPFDDVRYGPLCDAHDHYFHRVGCSPLHRTSELCAGCHELTVETPDGVLPVYTEVAEWRESAFAEVGVECQSCHMPETAGTVATGAALRDDRSGHAFLDLPLRRRALEVRATSRGSRDRIEIEVELANRRAAHAVPTGLPGRRIRVRAFALDRAGVEVGYADRDLARVLTDEGGAEVPYMRAVRELRDDRIRPHEAATVRLALPATGAAEIVLEVVWRSCSDAVATGAGVVVEEEVLVRRVARVRGDGRPSAFSEEEAP